MGKKRKRPSVKRSGILKKPQANTGSIAQMGREVKTILSAGRQAQRSIRGGADVDRAISKQRRASSGNLLRGETSLRVTPRKKMSLQGLGGNLRIHGNTRQRR